MTRANLVTGTVTVTRPDIHPGDILVATQLDAEIDGVPGMGQGNPLACDSAQLLAGELRRAGARRTHLGTLADFGVRDADPEARHALLSAVGSRELPTAAILAAASTEATALAKNVLREWQRAIRPRTVLLAGPRSFCAGVERAIETVELALTRYPHPVYVRKQIVHNLHVVNDLASRGAVFVDELDEVPQGSTVIFSAHGVSPEVRQQAEARDLRVIDATCPLVTKVHAEVRRFARDDRHVFLIGHKGHEESVGTIGEAPEHTTLVQSAADVARLPDVTGEASYVMQTTLATDEASEVVAALRARFPGITGPRTDDICYATTNRQHAVRAIAAESDLIYVIGSANSSNSLRLAELGQRAGTDARLVEDVAEIRLADIAEATTIGLTAGASAPPLLVEQVLTNLRGLGAVTIEERRVTVESLQFSVPAELIGDQLA